MLIFSLFSIIFQNKRKEENIWLWMKHFYRNAAELNHQRSLVIQRSHHHPQRYHGVYEWPFCPVICDKFTYPPRIGADGAAGDGPNKSRDENETSRQCEQNLQVISILIGKEDMWACQSALPTDRNMFCACCYHKSLRTRSTPPIQFLHNKSDSHHQESIPSVWLPIPPLFSPPLQVQVRCGLCDLLSLPLQDQEGLRTKSGNKSQPIVQHKKRSHSYRINLTWNQSILIQQRRLPFQLKNSA